MIEVSKTMAQTWGRLPGVPSGSGGLPTRPLQLVLAILTAVLAMAQTPATRPMLSLTATTDNVAGAHDSIRINLLRWSTDAERDQLLSAWTQPGTTGGRGARPRAVIDETDPAQADVNATAG